MASDYSQYPPNWDELRTAVLARAGGRCEGCPDYPDCRAVDRAPHPVTGARVVLAVAHKRGTSLLTQSLDDLMCLCQRCHLKYDEETHYTKIAKIRASRKKAAVLSLPALSTHIASPHSDGGIEVTAQEVTAMMALGHEERRGSRGRQTFRLDPDVASAVAARAHVDRISQNAVVNLLCRAALLLPDTSSVTHKAVREGTVTNAERLQSITERLDIMMLQQRFLIGCLSEDQFGRFDEDRACEVEDAARQAVAAKEIAEERDA